MLTREHIEFSSLVFLHSAWRPPYQQLSSHGKQLHRHPASQAATAPLHNLLASDGPGGVQLLGQTGSVKHIGIVALLPDRTPRKLKKKTEPPQTSTLKHVLLLRMIT